jgi:hypothetical protein
MAGGHPGMNHTHNFIGINERGSAIITILLISIFVVAVLVGYSQRVQYYSRENVSHVTKQKSFDGADSGINAALFWLRSPGNLTSLQPGTLLTPGDAGAPPEFSSATATGRYDVSVYRSLIDSSLVDASCTSYYYLARGPHIAPDGRSAQRVIVHAKIRTRYVGDFFAAVPDVLSVSCGSVISPGTIYGKNLTFDPCPAGQTRIGPAYFLNGYSPTPASFVTFLSTPPAPIQLVVEPNLVTPDRRLRAFYQKMAGANTLPAGTVLEANWPSPAPSNDYAVYYVPGDLHLGAGPDLIFTKKLVVYAAGSVYIHNNVRPLAGDLDNNWLGIVAEGDIQIASDAPDILALNGLFVTGGRFFCSGNARSAGRLTFNGGIVAQKGVDFASVYAQSRSYTYVRADPMMGLPSITFIESYSQDFNLGQREALAK